MLPSLTSLTSKQNGGVLPEAVPPGDDARIAAGLVAMGVAVAFSGAMTMVKLSVEVAGGAAPSPVSRTTADTTQVPAPARAAPATVQVRAPPPAPLSVIS